MRTPTQIRDDAVRCFNQLAPAKYDDGQRRKEVTSNLDKHPDLINAIREELLDGWFYVGSLAAQLDEKDSRIAELEFEVERWKELAKR
jgi:hypothetical protein